jgi:hypothetical protein
VVIQRKVGENATQVGFTEITLYGTNGSALDRSSVEVTMSSTYIFVQTGLFLSAWKCNDGLLDNIDPKLANFMNICNTRNPDRDPRIWVSYPCPSGSTSLSKVEVYQIRFPRVDCCIDDIAQKFTLGFQDAQGNEELPRQDFIGDPEVYTFMVPT